MQDARQAVMRGNLDQLNRALDDLDRSTPVSSHALYLMESARLMDLMGEVELSIAQFAEAESHFDQDQMRASLTVSGTLRSATSMVTNDRAIPYRGQLYEHIMVYYFQALNYLFSGDVAKARIELNKALRDMRWGKDNLAELRRQSDAGLSNAGIQASDLPPGFGSAYAGIQLDSSSDNALVYYLSGLLHQINGDDGRAEVDYRNALAYAADPDAIHQALDSLGKRNREASRLVILHESGWVASKVPFSLPVWINHRTYTLSFPYYPSDPSYRYQPESLIRVGNTAPVLAPMLSLDAATHKALQEAFPSILFRQALRMAAKQEMQAQAHDVDPWLGFATELYSMLSDSPDLRSWLSLPGAIYVGDLTLPPGNYPLVPSIRSYDLDDLTLYPGMTTILRLVSAQGSVIKVDSFTIPTYPSDL